MQGFLVKSFICPDYGPGMQVGAGAMTAGTSALLQVPQQIPDQFHKLDLKCKSFKISFAVLTWEWPPNKSELI